MSFLMILAVANLCIIPLHLSNARSAQALGESPTSSYVWAVVSLVLAFWCGNSAFL